MLGREARRTARRIVLGLLALLAAAPGAYAQDEPPPVRFEVRAFVVEGDNPLPEALTAETLAPFRGEHAGLEGLLAAADALEARLREAGFAFHRVSLPAQTLTEGTVRLRIVRFTVSRVVVEGNRHFSADNVRAAVPELREGESPNTKRLSRQLLLANDHPARTVDLRFREGEVPGALEAVLAVRDRDPQSWFVALNNTGTPATDDTRTTVGYQHANVFGKDRVLTATYTTSPRAVAQVRQFGLNYRIPLYRLGGALSLFWADSDVDSGEIAGFEVSGAGRFLGAHYLHHLPQLGRYRHSLTFMLEDKKFIDSTTPFVPPVGVDVRSRPVGVRYSARYPFPRGSVNGSVSYLRNIPTGTNNDARTYAARRAGASQVWDVVRFSGGFTHALPASWALVGRVDGQLANEALIPGEQYGAGGSRSVRGYDERSVSGDSGWSASAELWAPAWRHGIRFLGFADAGYVHNQNPAAGETESVQLSSIGVGARWSWREDLSVAVDWARVLSSAGAISEDRTKLHFNAVYRF